MGFIPIGIGKYVQLHVKANLTRIPGSCSHVCAVAFLTP